MKIVFYDVLCADARSETPGTMLAAIQERVMPEEPDRAGAEVGPLLGKRAADRA